MTYEIHTITNNVYHTKAYTYERDGSTDESPIVLKCIPSNGYARGKVHKFHMATVSHIVVQQQPVERHPAFQDRPAAWHSDNVDLARDMERGK